MSTLTAEIAEAAEAFFMVGPHAKTERIEGR